MGKGFVAGRWSVVPVSLVAAAKTSAVGQSRAPVTTWSETDTNWLRNLSEATFRFSPNEGSSSVWYEGMNAKSVIFFDGSSEAGRAVRVFLSWHGTCHQSECCSRSF